MLGSIGFDFWAIEQAFNPLETILKSAQGYDVTGKDRGANVSSNTASTSSNQSSALQDAALQARISAATTNAQQLAAVRSAPSAYANAYTPIAINMPSFVGALHCLGEDLVEQAQGKLQDVLRADVEAALANATLLTSTNLAKFAPDEMKAKADDKVRSDTAALASAEKAQDVAVSSLSPTMSPDRIKGVQAALALAEKALAASPKSAYDVNLVKAWRQTLAKAQGRGAAAAKDDKPGFLSRKVIGPVPGWGVALGGGGLLVGLGFLVRKVL